MMLQTGHSKEWFSEPFISLKNRSFAGRTVHRQKLINIPAFGFREVVALQLGNSKTGHSKEWFSEQLALSLKNNAYR
jgi:hypothetical protein